MDIIKDEDIERYWEMRKYVLTILFELFTISPKLFKEFSEDLKEHRNNLDANNKISEKYRRYLLIFDLKFVTIVLSLLPPNEVTIERKMGI